MAPGSGAPSVGALIRGASVRVCSTPGSVARPLKGALSKSNVDKTFTLQLQPMAPIQEPCLAFESPTSGIMATMAHMS
jgi:hypothetical protein